MARLEIHDGDDRTIRILRVAPSGLIETEPVDLEWEAELKKLYVVDPRLRIDPGDPESMPVQVTPEDGDAWLYGLQVNYRGIYFRGVYIEE